MEVWVDYGIISAYERKEVQRMQNIAIELKKVYERDMDMLIIEEFLADRGFARVFLDKVQLGDDYFVHTAAHSVADADGESDITLVLQYPDKKIALMIENKIDAPTMPDQSARYRKRCQNGVQRGEYDEYRVVLAAPLDYHTEHTCDKNAEYDYRVSYEEIREYLSGQHGMHAVFKVAMIDSALAKKKAGYQVQPVPEVTAFWGKLRQFCRENYPQLAMMGEDSPKGASARWPEFRTALPNVKVIYKSQQGYVDLEFAQYGDRIADLLAVIGDKKAENMQILPTGKSASVRLAKDEWKIDFMQEFEKYKSIIDEVMQAVLELCKLASMINYVELY